MLHTFSICLTFTDFCSHLLSHREKKKRALESKGTSHTTTHLPFLQPYVLLFLEGIRYVKSGSFAKEEAVLKQALSFASASCGVVCGGSEEGAETVA